MGFEKEISCQGFQNDFVVPVEKETIFAGTIKTHYFKSGEGRPVILLHGGGAGAVAWCRAIKELSRFFCVIAPDLVGYGESDKPYAFYDRHFFSAWLREFMDALGMKKCSLVGHSLGGTIASQFALDHPHRVEQLALICPAGLGWSFPLLPLLYAFILYSFPSQTASWRLHTTLVHRSECLDETFIEYAQQVCRKPGGRHAFWAGCGKAVWPLRLEALQKITQRTALIWGVEDRVFPLVHAYRAVRMMPHAQLHVIPQAGHIPFFDQPQACIDILLRFLREPC